MAEVEEKKVVLLLDSNNSISERRKMFREERVRRNRLCEESMLRKALLNAAYKYLRKFPDVEDFVPAIGVSMGGYSVSIHSFNYFNLPFPFFFLFKCFTGKDVTVTACFSYKTQRLQWEIVQGPLRRRLCLDWDDIHRLDLKLNESGLACLTVEVRHKVFPQCRQYMPEYNDWWSTADFTGEEKWFNYPPHHVLFKPGTADESYENLLKYKKEEAVVTEKHRQRYIELSQRRIEKKQLQRKVRKLSTSENEKEENRSSRSL